MITISKAARELVEFYRSQSPEVEWMLFIQWRKGDAENSRAPDGTVIWDVAPDRGWTVELGGNNPGKVPRDIGEEVAPGLRAVVRPMNPPFPGGNIDVENGHLVMKVNNAV